MIEALAFHSTARSKWVDANGAENKCDITQFLASNDETFGNSALVPVPIILLKSGQNTQFVIENVTGGALEIVLLAASATTDSAVSALLQVWAVE